MNTTIDPIRLEKNAIFDVSLKLLRQGKFHATPMNEIAYMAKLSGNLMDYVFQSRETLLAELSENTLAKLHIDIDNVVREDGSFKDCVFKIWNTFYEFYTRYPDMISFVEQIENVKSMLPDAAITYPGKFASVIALFEENRLAATNASPETLAWLIHDNALSAAKMKVLNNSLSLSDGSSLAEFFWQGAYGANGLRG